MDTQIQLIRTPEIAHKLVEIGNNVTARIKELEIETLVATEETVKGLKELRAELNKELSDFEEQRKFVKNGILNPYNEFEIVYKEQVSEKYTKAINTLKDKIAIVETKIKDEKANAVRLYFDELILAEKIDFLKFENLGLEINLSTSEKKYKEQVNAFIAKTHDDLGLIKSSDYEAETMAEYKKTLNVSQAITTVKTRKDQERIEAERIRQAEINRRKGIVDRMGMTYLDITDSFEYDDQILIRREELEKLQKPEFEKRIIEIENQINAKKAAIKAHEPVVPGEVIPAPAVQSPAEPIPAPAIPETKEEIVSASFKVEGTMTQLRSLGQYMKLSGIKYTNI